LFKFSLLICTFNGSDRISKTIYSISKLLVSNTFSYNVIIVDNNSSDNTFSVANQLKIDFADLFEIIVIQEFTQGKVFALESALNFTFSDWIVICDDDNLLKNDYLLVAYSLINNFKNVGIFGGVSNLFVSENIIVPEWFNSQSLKYAVGKQHSKSGYITYKENLWGAGSIIHRNGLIKVLKTVSMLVKNDRWEDSEIGYRFVILGYKLYFSEDLIFDHYIDIDRLNIIKHNEIMFNYKNKRDSLQKYSHFLKFYYFNNKRFFSTLKWNILYLLSLFKLLSLNKFEKYNMMINLFTNFGNDQDYKSIKKFYKLNKYNRLYLNDI
jgi:glycosyltransferase involved in cell wall biosynthesis